MVSSYLLSNEADRDIVLLFDYTNASFGYEQAVDYLMGLEGVLELLVQNPLMGRVRNEIKLGLRSFPYQGHIVFYRVIDSHIRVVRVLNGNRDVPKFLKDSY